MAFGAALLLVASHAPPPPERGIRVRGQNSVADALEERALTLGIDFERRPSDPPGASPTPSPERIAFGAARFGAWLKAEVERPDDTIAEAPAALREYLESHRDAIWGIVAVLEKGAPDWGEREGDDLWSMQVLVPTVTLERALLAAALMKEKDGDSIAASRALEAAWSLGRPTGARGFLIDRLTSIGIEKLQAGVLRKMREPSLAWMGRLSEPSWTAILDALERETGPKSRMEASDFTKAVRRVYRATADHYRKLSACDASRQTDDEAWRAVSSEVATDPNPGIRGSAESPPRPEGSAETEESSEEKRIYFKDDILSMVTPMVRRAARVAVDRELTLRILELRLDRSASRDGRWPERLVNAASGVCPEVSYAYSADGDAMEIRFDGKLAEPENQLTLPLSFRAGKTSTKTATSVPTPTPEPAKEP